MHYLLVSLSELDDSCMADDYFFVIFLDYRVFSSSRDMIETNDCAFIELLMNNFFCISHKVISILLISDLSWYVYGRKKWPSYRSPSK